MKIVVDSNIVFSAILNTKSKIGQIIINGSKYFDFYSIGLLKNEILKHKNKILKSTLYTHEQFDKIFHLITGRILFVEDILLTDNDIKRANDWVFDIDIDDALYVALNNHLVAHLWTGDKKLINGLKKKDYSRIMTTDDLFEMFLDKQLRFKQKRK